MKLHENLQLWLDVFVDTIPKESVINQLNEFQGLLDAEAAKVKELESQVEFKIKECQELAQACNRYKNLALK